MCPPGRHPIGLANPLKALAEKELGATRKAFKSAAPNFLRLQTAGNPGAWSAIVHGALQVPPVKWGPIAAKVRSAPEADPH